MLYRDNEKSRKTLLAILQSTFSSYLSKAAKKRGQVRSLALKGFALEQIWAQIEHHTSQVNDKLITQLTALMSDEDFLKSVMVTDDDASQQDEDDDEGSGDYDDEGEEGEEEMDGDEGNDYEYEKDVKDDDS